MSNFPTVQGFVRLFEEFEKTPAPGHFYSGTDGACALGVLALRDGVTIYGGMMPQEYPMVTHGALAAGFDHGFSGTYRGDTVHPDRLVNYELGYEVGQAMFKRRFDATATPEEREAVEEVPVHV